MKKIIVLIMVFTMTLSVVACNKGNTNENKVNTNNSSQEETNKEENKNNDIESTGKITVNDLIEAEEVKESDFFLSEDVDGGYVIMEYNGTSTILNIADQYGNKKITNTIKYIFGNGSPIQGVKFPAGMVKIVDYVCGLNTELQVVVLGENTEVIGESAFQGCTQLYDVLLNEGLTTISTYAFAQCDNLKNLTIPSSVTLIDPQAFYGCPDDFVIIGAAGSYAETFAKDAGIKFQAQ